MNKEAIAKVERIKAWARDNYEKSYGALVLVECWTDEELDTNFDSLESAKDYAESKSD